MKYRSKPFAIHFSLLEQKSYISAEYDDENDKDEERTSKVKLFVYEKVSFLSL